MSYCYAPDGSPITVEEWSELFERRSEDMSDDSWWRRRTHISNDIEVSTVWIGLDHSYGDEEPEFWETMIFGGDRDNDTWRYSSRQAALDDHERIIKELRAEQKSETKR